MVANSGSLMDMACVSSMVEHLVRYLDGLLDNWTEPHSVDDLIRSLVIQRDRGIVPLTGHRLEALKEFALAREKL
jgi:hypothetical protein